MQTKDFDMNIRSMLMILMTFCESASNGRLLLSLTGTTQEEGGGAKHPCPNCNLNPGPNVRELGST